MLVHLISVFVFSDPSNCYIELLELDDSEWTRMHLCLLEVALHESLGMARSNILAPNWKGGSSEHLLEIIPEDH